MANPFFFAYNTPRVKSQIFHKAGERHEKTDRIYRHRRFVRRTRHIGCLFSAAGGAGLYRGRSVNLCRFFGFEMPLTQNPERKIA